MRDQLGQAAAEMRRLKHILKDPAKIGPGDLIRVDTHSTIAKIQRPNIVESEDMIDMTVGDEDRIEPIDLRPQSLLTEIDRRIYENFRFVMLNEDGHPKSFVTRIVG